MFLKLHILSISLAAICGLLFEGNFDAFQGTIIKNNTIGDKKVLEAQDSGFHVFGDAREISSIRMQNGKTLILVTQNQSRLLAFEKK